MGCCISKCRVKKHFMEECNHVQDKLVISQAPKIPISQSNKISPCPLSPTSGASMSSISSCTCTTSSKTVSSSSSLSSGSSIMTSKDRSFSNEYLWSRVKENPHIVGINSIKERAQSLVTPNVHVPPKKSDSPVKQVVPSPKQQAPPRPNGSTPQKRLRQNSPTTLVSRQKSFRREPAERLLHSHASFSSLQGRTLRSPSPSRRHSGDIGRGISTITAKETCSKSLVGPKISAANSVASALRTENLRLARSYMDSSHLRQGPWLRNRARAETCIHRISSKIDENAVQEALAHHGPDAAAQMEDIDNPLISLDCFIFL